MGGVLIKRGKPCVATPMGARLCTHTESVRALEAELAPKVADDNQTAAASWKIMHFEVDEALWGNWLVGTLGLFCGRRKVLLEVAKGSDSAVSPNNRGAASAVLTLSSDAPCNYTCERVGTLSFRAVAAKEVSRILFGAHARRSSFANVPCVTSRGSLTMLNEAARRMAGTGMDAPVHVMPTIEDVRQACVAAFGWGLCPTWLVDDDLNAYRLVDLFPGKTFDVGIHFQKPAAADALVTELEECLKASVWKMLSQSEPSEVAQLQRVA